MTVSNILQTFDSENENDISLDLKEKWISELDARIVGELTSVREGLKTEAYTPECDITTELAAPDEYSEIYVVYLKMKMDYMLSEINRYNNSANLFNRLYYEMANMISRNFKVKVRNSIKVAMGNA